MRRTDGSGEVEVLSESKIHIQYISDTYTNGEWVPATPEDRKRDLYFQEFAKSTFLQKADFCVILSAISSLMPWGIRHFLQLLFSPIINHFGNDLKAIYQYMEDNLSDEKPWLSGATFGLADLNAIFPMDIAVHGGFFFDPVKYPKMARWHKALQEKEGYKKALEKGGTYNLKTWG